MSKSLASLKSQIEKLQKQADAMRSSVITRIHRDMAQHGLTLEDLATKNGGFVAGKDSPAKAEKAKKAKAGAAKPAKFADDQGNTWHGVGKRPAWIHDLLGAGRKLEEFLVGKKAKPAAAQKASVNAAATKKAAPKHKAAGKKAATKDATPKAAAKRRAKPIQATKAGKATGGAKPKRTLLSRKAPAKKAAKPAAAAAVADQASASQS